MTETIPANVDPATGEVLDETPEAAAVPAKKGKPKETPAPPLDAPEGWSVTELRWSLQAEREAEASYRSQGDDGWNLEAQLDQAAQMQRDQNAALQSWWVWCKEYQIALRARVRADLDYDRLLGRAVFLLRQRGERSAEVAMLTAVAYDDKVFTAKLARDVAGNRVEVANQNMKRLSAYLDDLRTQEANQRAMHQHANWQPGQA